MLKHRAAAGKRDSQRFIHHSSADISSASLKGNPKHSATDAQACTHSKVPLSWGCERGLPSVAPRLLRRGQQAGRRPLQSCTHRILLRVQTQHLQHRCSERSPQNAPLATGATCRGIRQRFCRRWKKPWLLARAVPNTYPTRPQY
jgi:hypothetical protein